MLSPVSTIHRTTVQQYFDKYFRGRLKFTGDTLRRPPLMDFLAGQVDSGFQYFGDSTRHTFDRQLRVLRAG